ncbi:MAG: hypothetical protein MUO64_21650 [Anaerolineales bacterium]|nr:hypothetical protein [Anaerolineales bacterium]
MGGTQGGAFFLDQDTPNQGRKVKSWRPRQKESAQESQTGSWRAASSRLNGTLQESDGLTSRQFIRYHLMRLKLGEDLPYLITGKDTKRAIASPGEVLALRPELASAG